LQKAHSKEERRNEDLQRKVWPERERPKNSNKLHFIEFEKHYLSLSMTQWAIIWFAFDRLKQNRQMKFKEAKK
jgi:hypothetical protein